MFSEKENPMKRIGLKFKISRFFAADFLRNPIVQWVLIASIFVDIADWAAIIFFIRPVDFPIILHYNVYFGVDVIGGWWQSYALPFVSSIILIVNVVLAGCFYRRQERIASYVLLLTALAIQIGAAIAEAGIILINY